MIRAPSTEPLLMSLLLSVLHKPRHPPPRKEKKKPQQAQSCCEPTEKAAHHRRRQSALDARQVEL